MLRRREAEQIDVRRGHVCEASLGKVAAELDVGGEARAADGYRHGRERVRGQREGLVVLVGHGLAGWRIRWGEGGRIRGGGEGENRE